jgi:hypothetical protein
MSGTPRIERFNLASPPGKLLVSQDSVAALVGDIVNLPAISIESRNGAPFFGWQKQKAVIEAGTAGSSLVLTVLIWIQEAPPYLRARARESM